MRITLVMPTLSCGGAERVGAAMANYWIEQGNEVSLITFDDPQSNPFYELSAKLCHIKLGLLNESGNLLEGARNNFIRLQSLRSLFKTRKADVIISIIGRSNIRVLFAALGLNIPIIVFEQIDPARDSLNRLWRLLRLLAYQRAQQIVVLTQSFVEYFPTYLRNRIQVIPNPIALTNVSAPKQVSNPEIFKIIAVGRLELQKGFDYLLQALVDLRSSSKNWTLTILGEGSQRQNLEILCARLNLADRVIFTGTVKDVTTFLKQSDLFVLSSRVEGFPLALCEAMACGIPVVATDCATSIREIVSDGVDGIVTPNEDVVGLTKAILTLMNNPQHREQMSHQAPLIVNRLSLPVIMKKWDQLLREIAD
jgi:GalNAc-alpha-(1->4)-GalNAc-alpha-(1->3)-diNAcBac-PP-undecaprenol alpha-1,4-N-acetyl-D-galactosaminyltransferase